MKIVEEQNNLANRLMEYEKDIDYYEYCDNYNDDDEAFEDILKTLRSNTGIQHILFSLQNDIEVYENFHDKEPNNDYVKSILKKARNIFKEVKTYQKNMNELELGR